MPRAKKAVAPKVKPVKVKPVKAKAVAVAPKVKAVKAKTKAVAVAPKAKKAKAVAVAPKAKPVKANAEPEILKTLKNFMIYAQNGRICFGVTDAEGNFDVLCDGYDDAINRATICDNAKDLKDMLTGKDEALAATFNAFVKRSKKRREAFENYDVINCDDFDF